MDYTLTDTTNGGKICETVEIVGLVILERIKFPQKGTTAIFTKNFTTIFTTVIYNNFWKINGHFLRN